MSAQQCSSGPKRPGANKRQWTYEEEAKLIEVLIQFRNEGKLTADKGFKPGQLKAIEQCLTVKLPGCEIKAKPHIDSKMRTFNKHFGIVHDMMTGPNCSGFGWDPVTKCVTAENAVWDEYLKSHSDAAPFRYKAFPHYEDLCIALGKDRATGSNAENPLDVVEELDKNNEKQDEDDVEVSVSCDDASFFQQSEGTSRSKKQKADIFERLSSVIQTSATILGSELGKSTDKICQTLESIEASDKRSRVFDTLKELSGLSMVERHKAAVKIGCDRELIDIFFTVPNEEKESFVRSLLE